MPGAAVAPRACPTLLPQASARELVAAATADVDSVNGNRKAVQEAAGPRLKALTRRWVDAVDTNTQIELAVADAEREVKRLRRVAADNGLLADAGDAGDGTVTRGGARGGPGMEGDR